MLRLYVTMLRLYVYAGLCWFYAGLYSGYRVVLRRLLTAGGNDPQTRRTANDPGPV